MDDSIDLQMPQTPQMPQIQMQAKYTHLEKKTSLLDHKKTLNTHTLIIIPLFMEKYWYLCKNTHKYNIFLDKKKNS